MNVKQVYDLVMGLDKLYFDKKLLEQTIHNILRSGVGPTGGRKRRALEEYQADLARVDEEIAKLESTEVAP